MLIVDIFEVVGTITFAMSGALVAIDKKLDLFGVILLGIITAVGGGIFRDLILGITPPTAFVNPISSIISMIAAIVTFRVYPLAVKKNRKNRKDKIDGSDNYNNLKYLTKEQRFNIISKQIQLENLKRLVFICDAIGLATFTAIGAHQGYNVDNNNIFLVTWMGFITGTGGGIVRDILVQQTPLILRREIYAVASILGAIGFFICIKCFNYSIAFGVCFTISFLIRTLSIRYNVNLPRYL